MENSDYNVLRSLLKETEEKYVIATEWQLATLEELEDLKSSSKVRTQRQREICNRMLNECRFFKHAEIREIPGVGRVKEALSIK
jgi:hypothetical protein